MSHSTTSYVAGEVRAEMGRQNHDNAWLAKKLEVSEMWVSRRLRGITEFSVDDVVRIAQALDVPVTQFLPVTAAEASAL